jgi:hypothetical protein
VISIPANEVETGESGVVELTARLGRTQDRGGETSSAVGVIESKVAVASGAHDKDRLIALQRPTTPLGGKG